MLYGSMAKGENIKQSDMDLFVLGGQKKGIDLKRFERSLGMPIPLMACSRKEFDDLKRKNRELVNNILNGISLAGFVEAI